MSLLRYALVGNLKRFLGNVKDVAKKEGKSSFVVFNKFLLCFARTGCGYSDYMNYKLYKRSWAEIDEYVTIKDQDKFYEIVCPSCGETVCFDQELDPENLICPACGEKFGCIVDEDDFKKISEEE